MLKACTVVEEPHYFDNDYLSEHSSFYSSSARGYPNICKRLNFFTKVFEEEYLYKAFEGDTAEGFVLKDTYVGFIVIRPLIHSPFGRSVLKETPDNGRQKKFLYPARTYQVHLAGLDLYVTGLAWQQQDSAVSACATIALWTILHSAAYDDYHAIPTTAEITKKAHSTVPRGMRVFPSRSLNNAQIMGAISAYNLAPFLYSGPKNSFFPPHVFKGFLGTLLDSRFPVLAECKTLTKMDGEDNSLVYSELGHAVAITGYKLGVDIEPDEKLISSRMEYIYVNDDNMGPNVRFVIESFSGEIRPKINGDPKRVEDIVALRRFPPCLEDETAYEELNKNEPLYEYLIPEVVVAAVPHNIRTRPMSMLERGYTLLEAISIDAETDETLKQHVFVFATKFMKVSDYFDSGIASIGLPPDKVSKIRQGLINDFPPMSLYIGVVRLSAVLQDQNIDVPVADVIYDTSENDSFFDYCGFVGYSPKVHSVLRRFFDQVSKNIPGIEAFVE